MFPIRKILHPTDFSDPSRRVRDGLRPRPGLRGGTDCRPRPSPLAGVHGLRRRPEVRRFRDVQRGIAMNRTTLTEHDRQAYRRELLELTDRLSGGVAQLEDEALRPSGSEGTVADAPAHDPVSTSSEADEDVARTVLLTEEQILAEARAALTRLDEGTFGRCERCGRAITKTRLKAVPYARHCIGCAARLRSAA